MTQDGGRSGNLFASLPQAGAEEIFQTLAQGRGLRIERIVSDGQKSPPGFWYEQAEDEWVMVLQGAATLAFDDGRRLEIGAGDWAWLPAGVRHRVEHTAPRTVWLAVFGAAAEDP